MSTQKLLSEFENGRQQYVNFVCMLYPEDPCHVNMLEYLDKHENAFQYIAILHDKDVYLEDDPSVLSGDVKAGDSKKAHWHVLIHCTSKFRLSAFIKFFGVWINHAEPCTSPQSYAMYMLHDTPDSMKKHHYDRCDLFGDQKLIDKYIQNSNFVQLGEVLDILEQCDGSMLQLLKDVSVNCRDDLLEALKNYQSLICTASNQEFKRSMHRK